MRVSSVFRSGLPPEDLPVRKMAAAHGAGETILFDRVSNVYVGYFGDDRRRFGMDLFTDMFSRYCTVSDRIKAVRQPEGGYLNPAKMTVTVLGEGVGVLDHGESINPDLAEVAVYYLWRFMQGKPARSAFNTCLYAALLEDKDNDAMDMIAGIGGLDRDSVVNAVNVCGFDICYKAEVSYSEVDRMSPDDATVGNIIAMVERSLAFSERFGVRSPGPVGFDGGYTYVVRHGFGDILTEDTIWNFRTSWSAPDERDTLRVLIYWRLAVHSMPRKHGIKYLGIFNPRRNEVYRIAAEDIPADLVFKLDRDIVGYRERWYYREMLSGIGGCSLSERVNSIEQPPGGYVSPDSMSVKVLGEGAAGLKPSDFDPELVASTVFRLAFFACDGEEVFMPSKYGAAMVGEVYRAREIFERFKNMADWKETPKRENVFDAVRLAGFDVCYEKGAEFYTPFDGIVPDDAAVDNIMTMVDRSLEFLKTRSHIRTFHTFDGGYTDVIRVGDGDFMSRDTLWSFRVSESGVTEKDTLELLVRLRMGLHSVFDYYESIKYLGVFNPMRNEMSRIAVSDIPQSVIKEVERDVIGYEV